MIVSCPSCCTRFLFKRSAFSRTTKRQAKCIKCATLFIIGPLPPLIHNSRAKDLKSPASQHERSTPKPNATGTWSNKSKRVAGALAGLLTLALLLTGGYFLEGSIVQTSLKPSPSLPELGNVAVLEIQNLELGWETNRNITQLSVKGELLNPSNKMAEPTGLIITLLDENDLPVLLWDYELPTKAIDPGQQVKFETSADDPPGKAVSVWIRVK